MSRLGASSAFGLRFGCRLNRIDIVKEELEPLLLEQLPPAFALGIRPVLDLVPYRLRAVGIALSFGDDALEVQPLHRVEKISPSLFNREHPGDHGGSRRH